MTASGVRSSCEALATKRFCVSNGVRHPVEHRVERLGQFGDLVVDAGVVDALVERLAGQSPRGRGDLLQRSQRAADHDVARRDDRRA